MLVFYFMYLFFGLSSVIVMFLFMVILNLIIGMIFLIVVNSIIIKQGNFGGSFFFFKGGYRMIIVLIVKFVDYFVNQIVIVFIGYGKNMMVLLVKIIIWFDEYLQLYK